MVARGNGLFNFIGLGFLLRVMGDGDVTGEELRSSKITSWLSMAPGNNDRKGFSSLHLVLPWELALLSSLKFVLLQQDLGQHQGRCYGAWYGGGVEGGKGDGSVSVVSPRLIDGFGNALPY